MRRLVVPLILTLLGLTACNGSGGPATPPAQRPTESLPPLAAEALGRAGWLGGYTLTIDEATASLTPWRQNLANDDLYYLGVDQFFRADHLRITGIRRTATTLELEWRATHPFPPPADFTLPPSAGNRADLGIAGRLVLLAPVAPADLPQQTFFGNVIANTALLLNPAGYLQPRGTLPAPVLNANCYPYQLLVDDGANNGQGTRIGQPNPGNQPTGNFDPSSGGWQRFNAGPARTSWTGYGVLHQGQSSTGTLQFDRAQIATGPVQLELGILAKYNDPRGTPDPRSKRLPALNPDPLFFAYRMPHGALDLEAVTVLPADPLQGEDPSATTELTINVRDWDARAAVTSEPDLSLDPLVNTVAPGEPGAPAVEISTPGISPIIATGIEQNPGTRTGEPGDEIVYALTVTATAAPEDGDYPALVRVTDPENASLTRRDYTFDLDPGLQPITDPAQQVELVVYQATVLTVASGPNLPPTCTGIAPSSGFFEPGGTFTVNLSQIEDDSNTLRITFRYTGPATSQTSELVIPFSALSGESAFDPFADSRLTVKLTPPTELGAYQLTVTLNDGANVVECGPYPFVVGIPGDCPDLPSTAPSLGGFLYSSGTNPDYAFLPIDVEEDFDQPSGIGNTDLAGFRDSQGGFVLQGNVTQQFWRIDIYGSTGIPLTTASYPGMGFANRAHTYDVDHQGRVFWVASNVTQSNSNPGLEVNEVYASAGQVIRFFDTTSPPVSADRGTINVGQRVVALAVDRTDNLWAIDASNVMRKYVPSGDRLTYSEDTSATFSLTTSSGGVLTGPVVEDFDINFHHEAFFVLIRRSNGQYECWRFECDGTYQPTVGGNPNPAANLFPGESVDRGDIVIDNYGPGLAVLAGQQDAQIVITGDNGPGEVLAHDGGLILTLTARMQKSPVEFGEDGAGRTTFLYAENLVITTESLSTDDWNVEWVEIWTPPTGWQ